MKKVACTVYSFFKRRFLGTELGRLVFAAIELGNQLGRNRRGFLRVHDHHLAEVLYAGDRLTIDTGERE